MSRATILIVDDEAAVRSAWEKALRYAGHNVLAAATPEEALELCDEHAIDVVVLDFIMPALDGVQLLVQIRRRLPYVRSLIVSGKLDTNVSPDEISSELTAGVEADLYLHKPLSNEQLRDAVTSLMGAPRDEGWKSFAKQSVKARTVTKKAAGGVSRSLKKRKKK